MSTNPPPGSDVEDSTVLPGETKLFTYVGEQIPNQVLIQNKSTTEQANFVMQAVNGPEPQWRLYGAIGAGETVQYMVNWPTQARFTNQGLFQSSIVVYGDGIFPGEQNRNS